MKLEVPTAVFTKMTKHIEEAFPHEACGLLFGTIQDSVSRFIAQEAQPLENISESPEISFAVDPEELYIALSSFEKNAMCLVAIYHSHRAPPAPSSSDLHFMEGWKELVWLVFSTLSNGPKFPFAGFVLKQGVVSPVTVQIL